jgi:succinate dehydrogenase/fumarate reductase flavoprotein subunit
MCRALIRRAESLAIPIRENRTAVELLTVDTPDGKRRACGAVLMDEHGNLEVVGAENVILAVGGPGGLYKTSVYPGVHTGAIGLGLMAGATAQSLPESQYGLASIRFRWNVSGTFMQVVPKIVSTEPDGVSDPREFLRDYFETTGEMNSKVFLKGYQWPFDSRKVFLKEGGSSLIDILVYIETVQRGRRVFLDFRENPADFRFDDLDAEALDYLKNSDALLASPIERLQKMNPGAIGVYADHNIDITTEPLEIAVCAQHNNGGLAGNHWWESTGVAHLFPIGEVNGSHGVYRPGGSALNSGQVAAIRAAEFITAKYQTQTIDDQTIQQAAEPVVARLVDWLAKSNVCKTDGQAKPAWQEQRDRFQTRMSRAGAHIRSKEELQDAVDDAWADYRAIEQDGSGWTEPCEAAEAAMNRYLCFAHAVYLEAVHYAVQSGVGSRGSAMVVDPSGQPVHDRLDETWRIVPEDPAFREKVQETLVETTPDKPSAQITHRWVPRRPIPNSDLWFETAWARFRAGDIYRDDSSSS